MYGVPELTVRKNGQPEKIPFIASSTGDVSVSSSGWAFYYKNGRTLAGAAPQYDVYPHSEEEFYVNIKYEEGIEKMEKFKFFFRYLTAQSTYSTYEGNIEKIKWEFKIEKEHEKCTAHSVCSWGDEHDSPVTHDTDVDDETGELIEINCHGGYHCTHTSDGYISWVDHEKYTKITLKYTAENLGPIIDTQDAAYCGFAERKYVGVEKEIQLGIDGIDLTTSLAGNVWLDISPQKDHNLVDGLMDESGLNNIPVTIYLYSGTTRIKEAIMHDANGNVLSWPIYTGDFSKTGYYEAARIEAPAANGYTHCFYVAEFKYDGQAYKHTIFVGDPWDISEVGDNRLTKEGTGAGYVNDVRTNGNNYKYKNSSCAVEDVDERYNFDQKFGEIVGKEPIAGDLSTQGLAYTTDENGIRTGGSSNISYTGEETIETIEKQVKSTLVSPATGKESNPDRITSGNLYEVSAKTFYSEGTDARNSGINRDNYRIKYPIQESDTNWSWQLNKYKTTSPSGAELRYIGEYMLNINLGLIEREHSDMSLLKDLYKVTIVVNEQKLTKQFNYLKDTSTDYVNSRILLETMRNTDGRQYYALGLYDQDVTYQSYQRYKNAINQVVDIKKETELRAYITYAIRVYNNSTTHLTELNEIADYYDTTYTLVAEDVTKPIVDEKLHRNMEIVANSPYYRVLSTASGMNLWAQTKEQNLSAAGVIGSGNFAWANKGQTTDYKESRTEAFSTIKLFPNQYIEMFTTYEIDAEGYQKMQEEAAKAQGTNDLRQNRAKLLGEKHNVAEITSYSTYYNAKYMTSAERAWSSAESYYYKWYMGHNAGNGYGWISGRIDQDSAPDNINASDLLNRDKYEDDTDQAIPALIEIETYVREMTGTVWEDIKNKELGQYNIKTGNGTYSEGDKPIKNVEVSMYEVINLGKFNSPDNYNMTYDSFDYYYKVPSVFYGGPVLTAANGTYKLDSFLAGDYVIRFDYGINKDQSYDFENQTEVDSGDLNIYKYNGQDYENTEFLTGHEGALNDKYLNVTVDPGNISVARDNESRRMVVDSYSRTIENDRGEILRDRNSDEFREATRMFAETPIIQVEIKDPKKVVQETEKHEYNEKYEPIFEGGTYLIANINLGLEKRAQTDMEIKAYITDVILTKSEKPIFNVKLDDDGNVIVTEEDTTELSKLTYVPHTRATDVAAHLYQQGFYAIAVDDNYMNGLGMLIKYKIVTTNKSETDFTGKLAKHYVASDIINLANKTPTTDTFDKIIADLSGMAADSGVSMNSTLREIFELQDEKLKAILQEDNLKTQGIEGTNNRLVDETDTIRPQTIVYGRYVGRFYYENKIDQSQKTYTINTYAGEKKDCTLIPESITYSGDKVVRTTVDKLINYIDIDARFEEEQLSVNMYWDESGRETDAEGFVESLNGLISKEGIKNGSGENLDVDSASGSYRRKSNGDTAYGLLDEKDRSFVSKTRSNIVSSTNERIVKLTKYRNNSLINNYKTYLDADYSSTGRVEYDGITADNLSLYNPQQTLELLPEPYYNAEDKAEDGNKQTEMYIVVTKYAASDTDANQLKIDNLTEILVYSNPVGRKDEDSVPGNAMRISTRKGMWEAGYNSYNPEKEYNPLWLKPEDDAYSPEYVTITAPTGIPQREYIKTRTIPIIAVSILTGVAVVIVIAIKRKKK